MASRIRPGIMHRIVRRQCKRLDLVGHSALLEHLIEARTRPSAPRRHPSRERSRHGRDVAWSLPGGATPRPDRTRSAPTSAGSSRQPTGTIRPSPCPGCSSSCRTSLRARLPPRCSSRVDCDIFLTPSVPTRSGMVMRHLGLHPVPLLHGPAHHQVPQLVRPTELDVGLARPPSRSPGATGRGTP